MTAVLWNHDLDEDCYRVRLMASLAAAPLALRSVDAYPGHEPRGAELMALNPLGRLPTLVDGDLVLRQTGAMMLHVARAGERGARFLPEAPEAARMTDWLIFAARDLGVTALARTAALFGTDEPEGPEAVAMLRVLEDHMVAQGHRGAGFVAGPEPSVADVALFPAFALSRDHGVDHDGFPALRLWSRRVRGLEGFVTMPGIPDYG